MLIKLYTNIGDIVIIEGIEDVKIKNGLQEYNPYVPYIDDGFKNFFFDTDQQARDSYAITPPNFLGFVTRVIEYAKDGMCRLFLCDTAYVCSNDGKTIHTVSTK